MPDVSESTRLCGTTGYNKSNRIQSARRLVHYRMRCSRVSAFGTRKRTTPFSAVSEVVSTSSPFSFFRTRDGRVPPMSMFMGASDGADDGSAAAEGASIATSAAAWVSSAEGSFAYRIQASQHRLKARDFFFRKRRDNRPASTTSTRRLGHATDLFRILLSFGISVLIFFLVLFQGPFSSGPSLGRLSSTVGSGRWALSCPLCGRLRPWLC